MSGANLKACNVYKFQWENEKYKIIQLDATVCTFKKFFQIKYTIGIREI